MKKKNIGMLLYLVSAVFNVIAIVSLASRGNSMGALWLCLGSSFLCMGTAYNNKAKKEAEENEGSRKE